VDTGDGELAVIKIEVAAPTPDQSVLTAQHLVALIVTDVKQRQTKLNLTPGETITTQQLEAAPTVEKKSIKIIRAIVVIAAAGLILTLGLVLAVDAIIRRRSRRKTTANWSGLNASSRVAMPSAPVGPSLPAGSTGRVRLGSAAAQNSDHTIVLSRVVAIDPVEPASPVSPAGSDILAPSRSSGSASAQLSPSSAHLDGLDVNYETGQAYDDIDSADSDGVLPEDSTIVLPLSNSQGWRHTNGGRPAGAARP
jgi:hypothetical protein